MANSRYVGFYFLKHHTIMSNNTTSYNWLPAPYGIVNLVGLPG